MDRSAGNQKTSQGQPSEFSYALNVPSDLRDEIAVPIPEPSGTDQVETLRADRSPGTRIFLWLLGSVSLLYAAVLIYHVSVPPGSPRNSQAFLEQCRQICMRYGLVSTGNIEHDARAFLTAVNSRPLSDELANILQDASFRPVVTQSHPLLYQKVEDFELLNHERNPRRLSHLLDDGPVVLVFYYGYACSHCVAQLYALNDDLPYFTELGARIVSLSADKPEETAVSFLEYGKFDFTVLSDPDNQVAEKFGCFEPVTATSEGQQQHGTFLIRQDGTVAWAYRGHTPFTDNRSLLVLLSELKSPPANSAIVAVQP